MKIRTVPPRLPMARLSRAAPLDTAGGAHAAHYQSGAHREWRAAVLARDSYTCQACGASTPGARLIADHVCELVDGGDALDVANGRALCLACHNAKTAAARRERLAP